MEPFCPRERICGVEISLVIVQANGRTQEMPVRKQRMLFGRKEDCQIRIPVSSVSREHCELRVEGEKAVVRDLGSSNGTYVNGERVQEQQLAAGDLVAIGPAVFVVRFDGQPAEINAAEAFVRGAAPTPVAAAAPPKARPSVPAAKPTAAKPAAPVPAGPKSAAAQPASKPAGKQQKNDESDFDLGSPGPGDSSVSDFDFDFLDEDDDKKL
jgi:predicted component of type VI protein secretion system